MTYAVIALLVAVIVGQHFRLQHRKSSAEYDAETIRFLRSQVAKMDGDGDGHIGGGRSRRP